MEQGAVARPSISDSGLKSVFQALKKREDSTELANETAPCLTSSRKGGAETKALREKGAYPRDNCMKKTMEELLHVWY